MNILIISHMFPSQLRKNYGLFVLEQIKAIKKEGHNVVVVSPQPWIPKYVPFLNVRWKQIASTLKSDELNGIKVYYIKSLVIPKVGEHKRGLLHFIQHRNFFSDLILKYQIDVIHAHTILIDGYLAILLKKTFNLPVIITIHGTDLLRALKNNTRKRYLLNTVSKADKIVLVSDKLKKQLNSFLKSKGYYTQLEVVYNGINPQDSGINPDWFGCENDFKILSVGLLTKQKNFIQVLLALKKLIALYKDIKYFIIGDGWHRKFYEDKILELNLEGHAFLLGEMPHEKVMNYISNSDLFILTSFNEGFGISYIEAMYSNKIVIGSKNEPIEEIIEDEVNGYLVDPKDITELYNRIRFVYENKPKLKSIEEAAHKTVWPKFSWQNNAKHYVNLYQKIKQK